DSPEPRRLRRGFLFVVPSPAKQGDTDVQDIHSMPQGLWLPLVTPFRDGDFDESSARRLAAHYAAAPIDGFILGATTGEGMTLDEDEAQHYAEICRREIERAGRATPMYLGVSGVDTRKLVATLAHTADWPIDGYL